MSKPATKQGKYGTLYLFEISYRDRFDPFNTGTSRYWAYDSEHAVEKFYDSEDSDGWEATSFKRVPEHGLMHRAAEHKLSA